MTHNEIYSMVTNKRTLRDKLLSSEYFIDNEYFEDYVELLFQNVNIEKDIDTQKHHILPKHYFNHKNLSVDNTNENLINLKFSDHIKAHYYLSLCCVDEKDRLSNEASLIRMIGKKDANMFNLEHYNKLYTEYQEFNRQAHLNKTHTTSDETRQKISSANKGKYLNHIHIYKGDDEKHIDPEQLDAYLLQGWAVGRPKSVKEKLSQNYNYDSKGMLGKHQSNYQKQAVSKALKGVSKSVTARNNMSKARLNKVLVSNEEIKKSLYVSLDELQTYFDLGYHRGRLNK